VVAVGESPDCELTQALGTAMPVLLADAKGARVGIVAPTEASAREAAAMLALPAAAAAEAVSQGDVGEIAGDDA